MKVIIMGFGRVGAQLTQLLENEDHHVTIIDPDPQNLNRLESNFKGDVILGVGFDRDILIQAGIEKTDAFVATSPSDNANIISARIARNIFHVPRVVARLNDPRRAEIYRRLGLVTISMVSWGAQRINDLLIHTNLEPTVYFGRGEVSLVAIEIPAHLVGRQVTHVTIPGETMVVAINRAGEALMASLGTEFNKDDVVYFAVKTSAMDRLESLLDI
jgi:trk system potassium uptake protein TrkA